MSKKLLMIIIGAAVAFLAVTGLGFYVIVSKISNIGAQVPAQGAAVETKAEHKSGLEPVGFLFEQESFIVNLADPGGKRYLRVGISLEVPDSKKGDDLKNRLPQLRDAIILALSAKRLDEIHTPEGKAKLKEELITSMNALMKEEMVKNLYFKEFVVQ